MYQRKRQRYTSWTDEGECKSPEELALIAAEIVSQLSDAAKQTMLALAECTPGWRDAIPASTDCSVERELYLAGCISVGSRSGDSAIPFQPLGKIVRDLLLEGLCERIQPPAR